MLGSIEYNKIIYIISTVFIYYTKSVSHTLIIFLFFKVWGFFSSCLFVFFFSFNFLNYFILPEMINFAYCKETYRLLVFLLKIKIKLRVQVISYLYKPFFEFFFSFKLFLLVRDSYIQYSRDIIFSSFRPKYFSE